MSEKKWTSEDMSAAVERALQTMEGVALELYRRGREPLLEELETVKRERDEWRDKFLALNQTAGELCNACGWAFRIPGEPCRCEVVKERDEARAEVERLRGILPELPPRAPDGHGLPRYGLRWNGPSDPASVPMADGYWTPWHLASDAYRRGAEAMREACAKRAWDKIWDAGKRTDNLRKDFTAQAVRDALRALPIPEDK